ncbi:MAG TPA: alpha/beta hydrolase [Alphaproteobacteria bacterium]|jgi:pimeloyl-ACP methyl ester carboxylesterase|nr:alpha/beta hydrolase [Alphaproteobacteria bacterium]
MRIRFVEAGGIHTRLIEAGEGEPLLLLHPVGFSADVWVRNMADLGQEFRLCAPDLLSHGFTGLSAPDGTIGHAPMVDHLAGLVDLLGFETFSIAGSSFGAQLGALLYLRIPERVRKLIVVGSASTIQPPGEVVTALAKTRANAMKAFAAPSWESCATRLSNLCFNKELDFSPLILSQLTAYARAGAAEAYDRLLTAMTDPASAARFSVRHRLGEIAVPTLLLWGRQDPRADLARAVEARGMIPNAWLETFEQCGHLPFFEQPRRFNRIVSDFLKAD